MDEFQLKLLKLNSILKKLVTDFTFKANQLLSSIIFCGILFSSTLIPSFANSGEAYIPGANEWASQLFTNPQKTRAYNGVVEMANSSGQRVSLIAITHIGPTKYFDRTNEYIKRENYEKKSLILKEFFLCKSEIVSFTNPQIHPEGSKFFEYFDQYVAGTISLDQLLNKGIVHKTPCVLDVDGKTLRPANYVAHNQARCDRAKTAGEACQFKYLRFPKPVHEKDADIFIDQLSIEEQLSFSFLFSYFWNPTSQTYDDVDTSWFIDQLGREPFFDSQIILTSATLPFRRREGPVVSEALAALKSGFDLVFIPWGAFHIPNYISYFEQAGFRIVRQDYIQIYDLSNPLENTPYAHDFFKLLE